MLEVLDWELEVNFKPKYYFYLLKNKTGRKIKIKNGRHFFFHVLDLENSEEANC